MTTFTWAYHTVATEYPNNGSITQFGNSYTYTEGSPAPDQRVFTLSFPMMKYFLNEDGSLNPSRMVGSPTPVLENAIEPELNLKTLEDHYLEHKLWKTFVYPHPIYGNVNVKYSKPLHIPAGLPGGKGAVGAFSIELREQP